METTVNCLSIETPDWQAISPNFNNNHISLWKADINSKNFDLNVIDHFLNEKESNRALSYRYDHDRRRFIISRGVIKVLLSNYTQQNIKDILLVQGINKRPLLLNANGFDIDFNITHSEDLILFAISNNKVGVDVEFINPDFNYNDILHACFTEEEKDWVCSSPNPRQTFYFLWTRKEALLKATGKGISDSLKYISCIPGDNKVAVELIGSEKEWTIKSFHVSENYIASIAYSLDKPVNFYKLDSLAELSFPYFCHRYFKYNSAL